MTETNPEIQAMIDEYGEATTRAAFAIAQSIGRKGIPGIDFSGAAERQMREDHYWITKHEVERHCNRELQAVKFI